MTEAQKDTFNFEINLLSESVTEQQLYDYRLLIAAHGMICQSKTMQCHKFVTDMVVKSISADLNFAIAYLKEVKADFILSFDFGNSTAEFIYEKGQCIHDAQYCFDETRTKILSSLHGFTLQYGGL